MPQLSAGAERRNIYSSPFSRPVTVDCHAGVVLLLFLLWKVSTDSKNFFYIALNCVFPMVTKYRQ